MISVSDVLSIAMAIKEQVRDFNCVNFLSAIFILLSCYVGGGSFREQCTGSRAEKPLHHHLHHPEQGA